jgi:CheY-like chemotaxis protein
VPQAALIVDDDPATCEIIQAILHGADVEAFFSTDSAQAAKLLAAEEFGAFFFDVNMPAPDGIELTRLARNSDKNKKTPIIIITGEEDSSVMARSFQAGANFLLFKPINRERLLRLSRATKSVFQQERRRYQRIIAKCKVKIQADQETLAGETVDISLNGVMLRASKAFPVGRVLSLEIFLGTETTALKVQGKVVRLVGQDMGIQLDHLSPQTSKRLQDFLLPRILGSNTLSS